MLLSEETEGECEEDYVQFGRDILFITSHRSSKYCGRIEGSLVMSPATAGSRGNNTTNSVETDTSSANITPLGEIFHILYITETATIPLPLRPQHGIGVSENIMFLINFSDITIYEQFVEELLSGIRDHFRPVD